MFEKAKQRAAERAAEVDARAAHVYVSTLPIGPRPFKQVEVLTGERDLDPRKAWANLRQLAADHGYDAVLGAALTSWDNEGYPRFVAYGTGVQWTPEDGH
ncbi:hypothetical protein AB0O91_36345 [Kitasatospora sp. NPDC089797]|uniref:hypothetical protein n=1 Tax=Kitasatospora sp. NPDC089797 TaxID=3155298 RepID=UPI00341E87DE